ncbi:hypothetical protein LEP1GSC186_1458 [Leptospira noguchii serovar Autumnalis str. ZUN142]|uniref:Uncharacterized protein n=1 Tax=Leptospira noguchii serovar Autumnalis str. ZUN142 TaxID=1085540 RepID=M6UG18_9LEPT|nr:hypothetical protein LEP1GSC186_1458 [Leptospira noguchii serovar Autumnalis str. ZUN142]
MCVKNVTEFLISLYFCILDRQKKSRIEKRSRIFEYIQFFEYSSNFLGFVKKIC